MSDFAVVGDINVDIIPEPVSTDRDIKKDGQVFVENIEYRRGGQAANFAVKAAEFGNDVDFYGKVGRDRHARFLESHLDEKGVRPCMRKDENVDTGTTMAVTWENGERYFLTYPDNNAKLEIDDIDFDRIKRADHLARRGIWFSEPMLYEGNKKLLRQAKQKGIETSVDLHWDPHWDIDSDKADERRQKFLDLLKYSDFLMGNEEEIKQLMKTESLPEAFEKIQEYGDPIVVVHQGEEGSTVYSEGEVIDLPSETVENPVNPTGTGDVYDAAFLNAWRNGLGLEEAGREATKTAVRHLKGNL